MTQEKCVKFIAHKVYQLRRWSIVAPAQAGSGRTT